MTEIKYFEKVFFQAEIRNDDDNRYFPVCPRCGEIFELRSFLDFNENLGEINNYYTCKCTDSTYQVEQINRKFVTLSHMTYIIEVKE